MATIKAIDGRSVHQIQSGQVIVDLNSVVKELVENSLDAGATSIEVRFKNQGLDSIEIQDNGQGISPKDYETVALKHHTSKLSSYEDLTSLETFGFRGEALSSLCALSKFHILTARVEDGAVGKRLDFEVSGKLKGTSVVAAPKGTTVCVDELFHNLPVRRRELDKSIKREYGKVIGLLHSYACISVGVKFAVSNQMAKGKKMTVFSTKSNPTTKENIVNVFGAKTLVALTPLNLELEMEPSTGPSTQSARNWSTQAGDKSKAVAVQGHISKPVFGEGRQAPDRQMFFVNSRPCFLPQVSKAINEVYKSFNVSQSPFIFANLMMDTNAYDVNVSPDKRTILLHDQTALLESLKVSLTEMFEKTDHTVPQSQLQNRKLPSYKPLTVPRTESSKSKATAEEQSESGESNAEESDEDAPSDPSRSRAASRRSNEGSPNLIESWACRNTELRRDTPAPKRRSPPGTDSASRAINIPVINGDGTMEPAHEKAPALQGPRLEADGSDGNSEVESPEAQEQQTAPEPDPMSTSYDDLFSQRPQQVPSRVQQLNNLVADIHSAKVDGEEDVEPEPPVVAIAPSSQKATPGPVENAFDRMRPKRTPLQTAEITVGNTTTTTVLGSTPSYKKRRIHQPVDSQSIAQFGASPLITRGLRQFAAPDSQMESDDELPNQQTRIPAISDDEPESEAEGSESEDEHMSDARPAAAAEDEDTSDTLDTLPIIPADDDQDDEDYMDEQERKIREDEKVARLIQEAEEAAARPSDQNIKRASQTLKNGGNRKDSTLQLTQLVTTTVPDISKRLKDIQSEFEACGGVHDECDDGAMIKNDLDDSDAEKRLSLTVSKPDFARMIVIGQYNLGFILAIRPASQDHNEDDLFIIDQHAADEKYNYERFQRTITLQNQRLVRPKPLELTAVEEEIILMHKDALKANGFEIETSTADSEDGSTRSFRLITLPISGEKTFQLSDLEELLHLLSETPAGSSEIPRPKKVQRMLAMKACRSSIMVGKTLTMKQMQKVVRHMGEMEKPWNCPHGRPTMRHLAGLGAWGGWREGDQMDDSETSVAVGGRHTDWKAWLDSR